MRDIEEIKKMYQNASAKHEEANKKLLGTNSKEDFDRELYWAHEAELLRWVLKGEIPEGGGVLTFEREA